MFQFEYIFNSKDEEDDAVNEIWKPEDSNLKKKLNLTNVRKRFITFMDMWVAIFLVHELSILICSKYSIFQSEHLDVLIGVWNLHVTKCTIIALKLREDRQHKMIAARIKLFKKCFCFLLLFLF